MSLRVNLILEEEQRSGGKLTLKSFFRVTSIALPALIILLIAQQGLRLFILSNQLNILESQWSALEPRQKQANRLLSRLNFNRTTKSEINAWQLAKPVWNELLSALIDAVPETIQLTSLRITLVENAEKKSVPSPPERTYQITLDGVTRDQNSMTAVQSLERNIMNHPVFVPVAESVKVANFAADPESSDILSRVFTIECKLFTMPSKERR